MNVDGSRKLCRKRMSVNAQEACGVLFLSHFEHEQIFKEPWNLELRNMLIIHIQIC